MSFFSYLKINRKKQVSSIDKESYSLVFNISSGSITGAIIKFTDKAGVNAINYIKEMMPYQTEVSIERHLDLMKSTLTTVAGKIQAEGIKKIVAKNKKGLTIDRVFYLFSSPWSISQTKTIRIKESKSFTVTDSYLNHVITEQEKQFQIDIAKSGTIIEKKIVQIKVNGYVIDKPNNQQTRELEMSILFTAVPEKILTAVETAVSKIFQLKNVWCHSLSLATMTTIKNIYPQKEDFIQLNISEEITDISIINNGVMSLSASIPLGTHHFIRSLSTSLKVTEEIAHSMVGMHSTKANDAMGGLSLAVAMDEAAREWLEKIFESISNFKTKIYVPDSLFLIAENELIPFIKDKLEKHDFKVLLIDNKLVKTAVMIDDIMFKVELMFLDNLYKI